MIIFGVILLLSLNLPCVSQLHVQKFFGKIHLQKPRHFFSRIWISPRDDREERESVSAVRYFIARAYVGYFWSTHDDVGTSISGCVRSGDITTGIRASTRESSGVWVPRGIESAAIHRVREKRVVVLLVVVNSCRTSSRFDHTSMLIVARRPLAATDTGMRNEEQEPRKEGKKKSRHRVT